MMNLNIFLLCKNLGATKAYSSLCSSPKYPIISCHVNKEDAWKYVQFLDCIQLLHVSSSLVLTLVKDTWCHMNSSVVEKFETYKFFDR